MGNDIYRRLQQHLDKLPIPFPATTSGVELSLLKKLFTEEEARIALNLSAIPEKVSKIHKRLKDRTLPIKSLERILYRMLRKGAIHGVRDRNNHHQFLYSKMPLAIGMFEAQVDQVTKGLAEDFFRYEEEAFGEAVLKANTRQMRTVPLNVRIDPEFQVSNYDDITEIIKNSPGPFAVMNCVCRQAKDQVGKSCALTEIRETCILLEGGVEFAKNLEIGREISRKEAFRLISRAKKTGLVLQPENNRHPSFICCCCGCCCGVLTAAKLFDKPAEFLHSNYYAEVNTEKCAACGTCPDRCQMDAIDASNGHMIVDLNRCIGCGACIPTCKEKAISLRKKVKEHVPPGNKGDMYKKIMLERFGLLKTLKFAAKAKLGRMV